MNLLLDATSEEKNKSGLFRIIIAVLLCTIFAMGFLLFVEHAKNKALALEVRTLEEKIASIPPPPNVAEIMEGLENVKYLENGEPDPAQMGSIKGFIPKR